MCVVGEEGEGVLRLKRNNCGTAMPEEISQRYFHNKWFNVQGNWSSKMFCTEGNVIS